MSDPTPIKITPISPKARQSESVLKSLYARFSWPILLIPVVLVLAYFVFDSVPTVLPEVAKTITRSPDTRNLPPPIDESALPFRDIELDRAQQRAKDILREFGQLQDRVESEELGLALYQDRYDEIIDLANSADGAFSRREFDVALSTYEVARNRLIAYVEASDREFKQELDLGMDSLNQRDLDAARDHLERANSIKPSDMVLEVALTRLDALPQVNELLRESQRSQFRGDFNEARELLNQVRDLDPETLGLQDRFVAIALEIEQERFNTVITQALQALDRQELELAEQHFDKALLMRPEDTAATSGLQRVKQQKTARQVKQLSEAAQKSEAIDDYASAQKIYQELLAINPNLQLAREGIDRSSAIVRLSRTIDRVLADPAILSSAENYDKASETLQEAESFAGISSQLDRSSSRLAKTLENASRPTQVVLLSDSTMEVRLSTIGDLGLFERKEVSLRPGRYLLTGSGHGCRDVRRTIVVSEGMAPVAIRCDETI